MKLTITCKRKKCNQPIVKEGLKPTNREIIDSCVLCKSAKIEKEK